MADDKFPLKELTICNQTAALFCDIIYSYIFQHLFNMLLKHITASEND